MTSKAPHHFFSGFGLCDEASLFENLIDPDPFCIAGFSFGAQKAFEYAATSGKRVDILQLFSPAFFQDQDEKYRRLQLMFYKKDPAAYSREFLKNCAFPSDIDLEPFYCGGNETELGELLTYRWDEMRLQKLLENGTRVEIFLGDRDKIIDARKVMEFFSPYATVYFFQHAGHILKGDK